MKPWIFALLCIPLWGCPLEEDNSPKTELEGIWTAGCSSNNSGSYEIVSFIVHGRSYTNRGTLYSDSSCQTPIASLDQNGTITIGREVILQDGRTAKEIDATTSKILLTFYDADSITSANSGTYCGIANWTIDTERDVTSCSRFTTSTTYTVYKIDGQNVFLGDPAYGTSDTPAERPTMLSTEFYTKE